MGLLGNLISKSVSAAARNSTIKAVGDATATVITAAQNRAKENASEENEMQHIKSTYSSGESVNKTTVKSSARKETSITNKIPTSSHVGVVVDIDGFKNEIILLNKTVDQDSNEFRKVTQKAQTIISKLQYLSTIPVPESFLKVEEEQSVIDLQNKIDDAYKKLEAAKANTPTYDIPSKYL